MPRTEGRAPNRDEPKRLIKRLIRWLVTAALAILAGGGLAEDSKLEARFGFDVKGQTVIFVDQSIGTAEGKPVYVRWRFGDENDKPSSQRRSGAHARYTYARPGTYTVTLTATRQSEPGKYETSTKQQFVTVGPQAHFKVEQRGRRAIFTNTSTGGDQNTRWLWDFGHQGKQGCSEDKSPVHEFPEGEKQTYTVTLTAFSSESGACQGCQTCRDCSECTVCKIPGDCDSSIGCEGCKDVYRDFVTVPNDSAPVADFEHEIEGRRVIFVDTSEGKPTRWRWDFGDGATSTDREPVHTYCAAPSSPCSSPNFDGTYVVKLTVGNDAGEDTKSGFVTVKPQRPLAAFTFETNAEHDGKREELTVKFSNRSIAGEKFEWDFGDGTTSLKENPDNHTYPSPATYPVRLTVTNGAGLDTFHDEIIVPSDRYLTHQLSYIETDRLLATLKVLDYDVLEVEEVVWTDANKPKSLAYHGHCRNQRVGISVNESPVTIKDCRRPVIVSQPASEKLSLVEDEDLTAESPAAPDRVLKGGSGLDSVTAAVPQQRLMIIWDKNRSEDLKKLLELIHDKLDVPAKQIMIEALVLEIDRNKTKDLGISYDLLKDGNESGFGGFGDGDDAFKPFTYSFRRPSVKTLLNFDVQLRALVEEGYAQVLSRPSILALDGRQARIHVGDQIPYTAVVSSYLTLSDSIVSSTRYITVGIVLNLRARASKDDEDVSMQVEVLVSSAGPGVPQEDATRGVVGPPLQSRSVQTLVRVANNTPFIVGGLIRKDERDSRSGIPWLSKIPGFGALFRNSTKLDTQKEVIVVITPHVIPVDDRTFAKSIAKDSELLDMFDLKLFRDSYRIRREDVFDLDFIQQSQLYQDAVFAAEQAVDKGLENFQERAKRETTRTKRRYGRSRAVETANGEGVAEAGHYTSKALKQLSPIASGNRTEKVTRLRQLQELETRDRHEIELTRESDTREENPDKHKTANSEEKTEGHGTLIPPDQVTEPVMRMLEDRVPGEEFLVTRMLAELVEKRTVLPESQPTLAERLRTVQWKPGNPKPVKLAKLWRGNLKYRQLIEDRILFFDEASQEVAILEPSERLPEIWRGWDGLSCQDYILHEANVDFIKKGWAVEDGGLATLIMWFRHDNFEKDDKSNRQIKRFDPPTARLRCVMLKKMESGDEKGKDSDSYLDSYRNVLSYLNCRERISGTQGQSSDGDRPTITDGETWGSRAILLNKEVTPFEEFDSYQTLKQALVLKRLLDINTPQLLTLKGFHVGREVVFPPVSDLAERTHLVDGKTAEIFWGIADYYKAFEASFAIALRNLGVEVRPEKEVSFCEDNPRPQVSSRSPAG